MQDRERRAVALHVRLQFDRTGQRLPVVIPFSGFIRRTGHGGQISSDGDGGTTRRSRLSPAARIGPRRIGRGRSCSRWRLDQPRIADAFGVREDTVRLWRSAFAGGGVDTLRATRRARSRADQGPGRASGRRGTSVGARRQPAQLDAAAFGQEIDSRSGLTISRSRLSVVLRQKGGFACGGRVTR